MFNVFTYGSLMYEPVWGRLTSAPYKSAEAVLAEFARFAILKEDFPGIIPYSNHKVEGRVYFDVSKTDLDRLDEFEGDFYQRQQVELTLLARDYNAPAAKITAEAYVVMPDFRHVLSDQIWDKTAFELEGLSRFMRHVEDF